MSRSCLFLPLQVFASTRCCIYDSMRTYMPPTRYFTHAVLLLAHDFVVGSRLPTMVPSMMVACDERLETVGVLKHSVDHLK